MAGPSAQQTVTSLIPLGESDRLYAPSELAGRIENMRVTPEGTLETLLGPAPWIPNRGAGYPAIGEPYGIFHAALQGGMSDLLLLRAAGALYRYSGWNEGWEQLVTGLTNERHPRYPDQFVMVSTPRGGMVVWTNGVDRARLINYDGQVIPLGFEAAPATPDVDGPTNPASHDADDYLPNSLGYSWHGGIGDAAHLTDAQSGWLLDSAHAYAAQLEDEFGNLSPISPLSSPVAITSMFFSPLPDDKDLLAPGTDMSGANMDDHTRQFLLRYPASGHGHAVAVRFYRTMNMKLHGNVLRFLGRHMAQGRCIYPDGKPDALLGAEAAPIASVPVFRVMTAHNGALVLGNFPDAPGLVRESQSGFPGTFLLDREMSPDSGGAEVTALASHNGALHAWTETSTYVVPEWGRSVPLRRGVGNSAPRSVQALPNGMLVWLSHDGFYGIPPGGGQPEKLSGPIHRLVRDGISPGRMRLATSAVDPQTGTYICSVSPAGRTRNLLQVCFDGNGFRRYDTGMSFADLTRLDDWRGYVLGCGYDGTDFNVYALHREVQNYTPPARTAMFRSRWIMADETGSLPVRVRKLYVGMVDGSSANVTVRFYRDGNLAVPVDVQTDLRAIGPDTTRDLAAPITRNPVSDIAGSAVIGTSLIHARRAFWRYVTPNSLEDCFSWAFEIRADYPTRFVLAAFAFDQSVSGAGDPRGRILRKDDA